MEKETGGGSSSENGRVADVIKLRNDYIYNRWIDRDSQRQSHEANVSSVYWFGR